MQVSAKLDLDVVAVESDDEIAVMLELAAPPAPAAQERPSAAVQVVLDRSGSMDGERLEAAKDALLGLVDRLDPADSLGVVAFDDEVQIVVPAGPLSDRAAARRAIRRLHAGGCTDLSGGLLRGMQEARRVAGDAGATLLLLSDGHANAGEVAPARLAGIAAAGRDHGVTTSTVGIGLGYDEDLLSELARAGAGNHVFAPDGDSAKPAVAGEVDGLLSKTVQAASLIVRPAGAVEGVTVWNDLPAHGIGDAIMVEVGDLWAGETRKLVLTFKVPAKSGLGLAQVAELELRHVALPELEERTVTLPVHVNVVPGDQAAGRVPDPEVRKELTYQQVQQDKRRAADALRDGDHRGALDAYRLADLRISDAVAAGAPPAELEAERELLAAMRDGTVAGDGAHVAKRLRADHARKSRRRGRDDLGSV